MKGIRAALSLALSLLTVAWSAGLAPYQAAAQVVRTSGGTAPAVPVVPAVGAGVPSAAPLFAPGRALTASNAPAVLPVPVVSNALSGPRAALDVLASGAGRLVPAALGLAAAAKTAVALSAPLARPSASRGATGAPEVGAQAGVAPEAKAALASAGERLAGSEEGERPGVLESVFHGAFLRRSGDGSEPTSPAGGAGSAPSGLRRYREALAGGRAAEEPPAAKPAEGPVKVPKALWGLLVGDIFMTIGMYMHILSQPFLVQGLTGSSAAVGVVRNIHYGSYTASSFFELGAVVDKTDYGVLMAGSYMIRALLMGAIPLLFMTGHLTLAALSLIVAINPFFQNISTTTDEAAQISILGTDERVINKGKALVTKVMAVANLLPLISGLIVGSLVAAFGATAGYAYAYAGYAAFLLLGVPFIKLLLVDPRHADPNVKDKPTRNWLNLFVPLAAVIKTLGLVTGVTHTLRRLRSRYFGPGAGLGRRLLAGLALLLTSPLWLLGGSLVVQAQRAGAAIQAVRDWLAARRAAAPVEGSPAPAGARERLARFLEGFESLKGISFILRNDVLWILSLVATANLFLADALDFVVMPNFIAQVIVPRLDLARWPVIGGLLSTGAGVFTLLIIAGSAAALYVTRLFEGDSGLERIKRWGHKSLYRVAALGSASFFLLLIPAFFLAPTPEMQKLLEEGYRLMEEPATRAAGQELITRVLDAIPMWKFGVNLGITMVVQFLTSLLQVPLLLAMAPVRNKQIPPDRVGSIITAFTIIEVILMGLGSLALGLVVDSVTIQIGMLVVMGIVAASAVLEWLVPNWLSRYKPEGWYERSPKPKK